jgi:Putative peptidoglycan binding domain
MKPGLLICIGSLTLALTAGAQIPNNHRKALQRTTYPGYRGTSAVQQVAPQRTVPTGRFRQPTFSTAQFRQQTFRTTRMQPRTNSSFVNRPAMTSTAAWRQTPLPVTNDWRESRFSARPRPNSALVNRSAIDDIADRRQTRLATANDWRESRFRERPRPSNPLLNRFTMNEPAARRQTRGEFNNRWANSNFRRQDRNSFANRSRSTSFWSGRRAAVTNNWRGDAFNGRQYWAFRNYQSQWHDRGWWHHHCDRIVFVTVYSQPFPFFFDAGYWYPAWGYYPDSYYPYDGPIYGYNDLPPDEVITNVQTQLYYEGYYDGPIDGILGPDTRAAIANYQADHGLAVTAAIDEPTVESLGLG